MADAEDFVQKPSKRRRISYLDAQAPRPLNGSFPPILSPSASSIEDTSKAIDPHENDDGDSISLQATSKMAGQAVAPFLAKHVPDQYNPMGGNDLPGKQKQALNTKFCYRHRPDLKCRRQVDEPSMAQLQEVEACSFPPS